MNWQNVRPDMIIVILPAEAGPIRQAIKYYGDVVHGLATQCVVRSSLSASFVDLRVLNTRFDIAARQI